MVNHGIHFQLGPLILSALFDTDWASGPVDRKSTLGNPIYLGCNFITRSIKKQPIVSRITIESEYRALANIYLAHLRSYGVDFPFILEGVVCKDIVVKFISTHD